MPQKNLSYVVPERFLRQIWKHQQFATSHLHTMDGKPVEILSPGTLNTDGGPDFSDARIRIGGVLYTGDVELHQNYEDWTKHSHHVDPKYNKVILHVVFQGSPHQAPPVTQSNRAVPVLILQPYLTSTYHALWEKMILDERSERLAHIKCFSLNESVSASTIRPWLEKLAIQRIELKVRRFEERLQELVDEQRNAVKEPPPRYEEIPFGLNPEDLPPPTQRFSSRDVSKHLLWSQLLYEGIMEGLGYAKNQQPFLKLARNLRLRHLADLIHPSMLEDQLMRIEAMIFGVAGLLPPTRAIVEAASRKRVRELRSLWKDLRKYYRGEMLAPAEWQFFRLRPENFPTVRLAGGSQIIMRLFKKDFFKTIIQTTKNEDLTSKQKLDSLEALLTVSADDFWSTHYRFEEKAQTHLKKLVGKNRADEIILNTFIPICLLYARIFKDKNVRRGVLTMFEESSPQSENAVIRIMKNQLVRGKVQLDSAMLQQGALQLYKFYCVEEQCKECAIGKEVFNP